MSGAFLFFSFIISSASQEVKKLSWFFEPNRIAIDANEIYARLSTSGYDSSFFKSNICEVKIIGLADCNNYEDQNEKVAAHRVEYLVNYFESRSYSKNIHIQSETNAAKPCSEEGANSNNRRVDFVFMKVETLSVPIETNQPTSNITSNKKLEEIIELNVGETLVLDGLNFIPGKHIPVSQAKPVLKKLLQIMIDNPTLEIEIQGHICCGPIKGPDGVDMDTQESNLSWTRAQAIYDHLIANGVDASRLSFKGFAMTKPLIWPEVTIQDQNKNRRVEVMVKAK